MYYRLLSCVLTLAALPLFAGETLNGVRHISVGPDDIVSINCSVMQYTSIILDEGEKALIAASGDKNFWPVEFVEGNDASRFLLVKPSKDGRTTDIQVITDHQHNYTIRATADPRQPVDLKVFLEPADKESLKQPPSLIPASAVVQLTAELQQSKEDLAAEKAQMQHEVQQKADSVRATVPQTLHFDYTFERDRAPFYVDAVWNDGKFTYIKAKPEEVASFYEIKDGKLNLVEMSYANGLYTIRKVIDGGVLQVGKKKLTIQRKSDG